MCVGYSALFSALCEAQGIYVVNVKGTATSDTVDYDGLADGPVNHEWCAALIDDRWIWVDCVWDSALKFENNEFRSIGANTEMYFDISPLALSFDHCAYLAEKRYYFRAEEYFADKSDSVTPDKSDSKPESETSDATVTSTEESVTTKPQTYTAPKNYTPVTSDIPAQEESDSANGNLTWIAILTLFVAVFIVFDFISIKKLKK